MIEFYRNNYKELPNSSNYIKTWYHSDWKIKKINKDKDEIIITKKSYQGILTGFLGYSQLRGKKVDFIESNITIRSIDYYYTNPIARASKTMSECRKISKNFLYTGIDKAS